MNILAFDTALGRGGVAVVRDGVCLAQTIEPEPRRLAEQLMPMIERALDMSGLGYEDIDRIGTTVGPGTFTGLRLGVAAARGLSLAAGIPVIGVTTLEALAETAMQEVEIEEALAVAIDARRGQVYFQTFLKSATGLVPLSDPCAVDRQAAPGLAPRARGIAVGSAADVLVACGQLVQRPDVSAIAPAAIAELAVTRPLAASSVSPLYLRSPDAKLPKPAVRP
ncbi:MAG: tRNA (adenosine(37)-N6)-threonylcarbamoyltransferase complex dimerization subunit type 1 TsaB [Alphaproteobacteria bacterium]